MSEHHDYGPLRTYQVTYKSGHIEQHQGQQVMLPAPDLSPIFGVTTKKRDLITIHGEFDGHWRLVLAVREDLVESVKDITDMDLWAQLEGGREAQGGESA